MENKLSVIIPIFNVEKYIDRCMKSILTQTLDSMEVILVDDGSTDESGKIADQYAIEHEHIRVIHKQNGGLSSARNEGLKFATGEYVSFIDPDDWIEGDMLEEMYKAGLKENADIVMCEIIREFDGIGEARHMRIPFKKEVYEGNTIKEEILPHIIKPGTLEDDMLGSSCRNIYRRKILKENNLWFDEKIRYCEDIVFNCEVFSKTRRVVMKNKGFYHYHVNPASLLHSYYTDGYYSKIILYSYDKLLAFAREEGLEQQINVSIYSRICESLNPIIINFFIISRNKAISRRLRELKELLCNDIISEGTRLNIQRFGFKQKFLCSCTRYRLAWVLLLYGYIWFKLRLKGNLKENKQVVLETV